MANIRCVKVRKGKDKPVRFAHCMLSLMFVTVDMIPETSSCMRSVFGLVLIASILFFLVQKFHCAANMLGIEFTQRPPCSVFAEI